MENVPREREACDGDLLRGPVATGSFSSSTSTLTSTSKGSHRLGDLFLTSTLAGSTSCREEGGGKATTRLLLREAERVRRGWVSEEGGTEVERL